MDDKKPLVTVITPAYNASATILRAVESVQKQSFSDWEMLIADDCSSDDTVELIKQSIDDPRVKFFLNEENLGPAGTRNVLLEKAQGRYVAFLDADDSWLPLKLEKQLAAIEAPKAKICCTGYIRRFSQKDISVMPPLVVQYSAMLRSNLIPMLTAMIDTEQTGAFKFQIKGHEDYQLWLDLLRDGGECVGVQEYLAIYSAGEVDSVSGNKFKAAKWHWDILSQEPLSMPKRLINFCRYIAQGILKNV